MATINLLLVESWKLRFRDPAGMLHLAELARLAIDRLDPRRLGFAAISDLRARALGELANAQRVEGDPWIAELTVEHGARWARRGTGNPMIAARLAEVLGSIYIDQGRAREAAELLDRLAAFYHATANPHRAGRAQVTKAIALGYAGEPERGIESLAVAAALIDPVLEPTLPLALIHCLVGNLFYCGRYREARIILWRARRLFIAAGDPLILLRLSWWEGMVNAGLGDFERAEAALRVARDGFKSMRLLFQAALCGRDLATVALRLQRGGRYGAVSWPGASALEQL